MNLRGLAIREMVRRPRGLLLSVLAATVATAAYVSVETTARAAQDTIRKLMLKLGHNYLLVPKGAPHDRLWAADFGEKTMPEFFLDSLMSSKEVTALRYVGMLERRVEIDGAMVVLTGVRFELGRYGELTGKGPFPEGFENFNIRKSEEAYLGSDAARRLRKQAGDTLVVEGETFRVARVLPREGTLDDLRVYVTLPKAQAMYAKVRGQDMAGPPVINGLLAFGCICPVEGKFSTVTVIKRMIEKHYAAVAAERGTEPPEVVPLRSKFEARADARRMLQSVGSAVAVALLALCGLAVAFYIYHTTSRARYEIALLAALGYRPRRVALTVLSKVLLVAILGGLGGLLAGTALARAAGPHIVAIGAVPPHWGLWWHAVLFSLVLCLAAAGVAIWGVARVDPAQTLRNQ